MVVLVSLKNKLLKLSQWVFPSLTSTQNAKSHLLKQHVSTSKKARIKEGKGYDPRKLLAPGTQAITDTVEEIIDWIGTPEAK